MRRKVTLLSVALAYGLVAASCSESLNPAAPALHPLIFNRSPVDADGSSIVNITATADTSVFPPGTMVAFATSAGTLSGTSNTVSVPLDASGTARAQLRAPTDSIHARLTAAAGTEIVFDSVVFVRALPDSIVLSTDRITVNTLGNPANAAKITATLVRVTGTPSPGQFVTFTALTEGSGTEKRGTLVPPVAQATGGVATTVFFSDTIASAGYVRVRAQATGTGGTPRSASVLIQIK